MTTNLWGVGVELVQDHLGPLRFAARLAQGDTLVGAHVMPTRTSLQALMPGGRSSPVVEGLVEEVRVDIGKQFQRAGVNPIALRPEVIEDDRPDLGLTALAEREAFTALIIGRRARRDDDPLVRLGEVARRVLRRLPVPVIVVPPDFGTGGEDLAAGPVMLATDLDEHGSSAAAFAKMLAARLDRPLLVAHGTEVANWGMSYIPTETFELMLTQARNQAAEKLHAWVLGQGLDGAQERVFMGDPARNLAQLALDEEAAIVVVGSRKLGPVERIFLASVSSELAASTRCPTAVV